MTLNEAILLAHAASTAIMAGLIWFVQIVHYPLMQCIGPAEAHGYAVKHQQRTTLIVGPTMLVELGTAVWIALHAERLIESPPLAWMGLGLLVVIWLSTAFIQVPQHRRLLHERSPAETVQVLVQLNWIRTVSWTARLGIALIIL